MSMRDMNMPKARSASSLQGWWAMRFAPLCALLGYRM